MALLACHMMKFKQADLKGMEIHNDRKSLHSSNKDIDYSRTPTNFDALTGIEDNPQINYPKIAKAIIEKKYTGTRAIRSDAVYAVGFIVTAKNEFFANMSNDDQKRFFKVTIYPKNLVLTMLLLPKFIVMKQHLTCISASYRLRTVNLPQKQ